MFKMTKGQRYFYRLNSSILEEITYLRKKKRMVKAERKYYENEKVPYCSGVESLALSDR